MPPKILASLKIANLLKILAVANIFGYKNTTN